MLYVSRGNSKLGNIPCFNLPPVLTCEPGVPCSKLCYARKAYEWYSTNVAKPQWDENFLECQHISSPDPLVEAIEARLSKKRAVEQYFRIHSSGDFFSERYLQLWQLVASRLPRVHFLAYTKRYSWIDKYRANQPSNLKIVRSLWYPMGEVSRQWPNALVLGIPGETRTPDHICPGDCSSCKLCWSLDDGQTVGFHLH